MSNSALLPRSVALRDGRSCLLRDERESDARGLLALDIGVERSDLEIRLSLTALRAEVGLAVVAEAVADGIVGHLVVGGPRRADGGGELAIFVDNRWRRGGLGSQLIELALVWARTVEIPEISVRVDAANAAARGLYEVLGFRPDPAESEHSLRLTLST